MSAKRKWQRADDWHKMRQNGTLPKFAIGKAPRISSHRRYLPDLEPRWRDRNRNGYHYTHVNPISLHPVAWLNRKHDDLIAYLEARIDARRMAR